MSSTPSFCCSNAPSDSRFKQPAQWPASAYSLVQSVKLRRFEQQLCGQADAVVAVSIDDAEALQGILPGVEVAVVPNGVDTQRYHRVKEGRALALDGIPEGARLLLFTGSMDFRPNVDAMEWFVQEVLPEIRAAVPEAHLAIVGRNPTCAVWRLKREGVTVKTGRRPGRHPVLRSGRRVRAAHALRRRHPPRAAEALAYGLPVVTTSMGASGIEVVDGDHVAIADSSESFMSRLLGVLQDPAGSCAMAERGRALALTYDWNPRCRSLKRVYDAALASGGSMKTLSSL